MKILNHDLLQLKRFIYVFFNYSIPSIYTLYFRLNIVMYTTQVSYNNIIF
jgi:hypothetical protein